MAATVTALLTPVLALDGESIAGSSTAIALLSVISIVAGYLVLFGLWYFIFRDPERRSEKQPANDQPSRQEDPGCQTPAGKPAVQRKIGPRFRRR
ncbi:MAG TPA: hypothetical protein VID48_04325 [Solirubrobacteraceae bacterium]